MEDFVAVQVLTSADLFRFMCAFLPGQATWLAELERTQSGLSHKLELTLQLKLTSGTPGLMPFLAIEKRDLRALKRLWILHKQPHMRKNPRFWFHTALHDAATCGNLEALEWLHAKTGEMCAPSTLNLAAMQDHTDIVQWLLARLPEYDDEAAKRAMARAAATGRLGILKIFHEWRPGLCTSQMMDLAAAKNHLEIIQFLHEHGHAGCTTAAVDKAAENGHVRVVEWLLANREEGFTDAAMRGAVMNGHLAVVTVLWEDHRHRYSGPDDPSTLLTKGMRMGIRRQYWDRPMLNYLCETVGARAFPTCALSLSTNNFERFTLLHSKARPPQAGLDSALVDAVSSPRTLQYLIQKEQFSPAALNAALDRARLMSSCVSGRNTTMALRIALIQTQQRAQDPTTNVFAPIGATTARAHRRKDKARKRAMRPPRARIQGAPGARRLPA